MDFVLFALAASGMVLAALARLRALKLRDASMSVGVGVVFIACSLGALLAVESEERERERLIATLEGFGPACASCSSRTTR